MPCPDDATLIAMVEHELPPARFAELEVHIDSCEHCRKAIAAAATSRELALGTPASGELDRLESIVDVSIGERYVIEALLGRGGMGTVYLARDRSLGREVALKVHRAGSGKDRLQREAVAMAKLAHPNVVTVFEIGELDDRLYVAMEYVRGTTLRGWLDARPRTWREVLALLADAGAGLAAAHAAGLVHRDFKPENVLVGDDGRPRVGDFGLARMEGLRTSDRGLRTEDSGDDHRPAEARSPKHDVSLTQTGALLGTPAYMAPEQLVGDVVDARCDQFAFCVVAWECLYGKRPFTGPSIPDLELAIQAGPPAAPPRRAVPERVRRVLARGLAADPAARYPDLPALLAALRTAARPARRGIVIGAAGVLALAGALVWGGTRWQAQRRAAACDREGDAVAASFDPLVRARVGLAFAATGAPFAGGAFDHAAAVLDQRRDALATRTVQSCRADEPGQLATARRACLAEHARELSAVVDVLAHADRDAVQRAPATAWAVSDPAACDDARELLARPPATAASAPDQAAELARIEALGDAGRYREVDSAAAALVAAAHARGDRPLELAASLELGEAREELEDPAAMQTLQQALALAESLGRDLEAARVLEELAHLAGVDRQDYATAHRDVDLARAKLERLGGGNLALDATLRTTEAQILFDENRLGEAEPALRRAVTQLERAFGPDDPKLGDAYGSLSEILLFESKLPDALAAAQRARDILARSLGDDHPTTAGADMTIGEVLVEMKRFDEARARLLRADAVFRRVFGDVHPARASVYGNLGGLEQQQEHWDAAIAAYRQALAILERTEGPESTAASSAHADIARVFAVEGRYDDALPEETRALAILDKLGPDAEPRLPSVLVDLADIQLGRKQPALALSVAERALALATARPADANPEDLADARFVLARALWDTSRDRTRARALATQAAAGEPRPEKLTAIQAWLAAHH